MTKIIIGGSESNLGSNLCGTDIPAGQFFYGRIRMKESSYTSPRVLCVKIPEAWVVNPKTVEDLSGPGWVAPLDDLRRGVWSAKDLYVHDYQPVFEIHINYIRLEPRMDDFVKGTK